MKHALVLGAGGFIGSHMVKRLKDEGFWVRGVDLKRPEFGPSHADEFVIGDLRCRKVCEDALNDHDMDEVYQFAADMGGAGFIFVGDNDSEIMHNSGMINLNMAEACSRLGVGRIFYSSSACIYPQENQLDPDNPNCEESSAYPANPDSDYGWEKLFSERLYLAYARNNGLTVRIARYHNVFGPEGTWEGGREKLPAAACRKVAQASSEVEVWGDGAATRSFLFIDECLEGTTRLLRSDCESVLNIGSDEMISVNNLVRMAMDIAGKNHLVIKNVLGPEGVRGRNSDNHLIQKELGWAPNYPLRKGMEFTYQWIQGEIDKI
jgi:nucleoside-diphosphate-sugar epimerase